MLRTCWQAASCGIRKLSALVPKVLTTHLKLETGQQPVGCSGKPGIGCNLANRCIALFLPVVVAVRIAFPINHYILIFGCCN